MQTQNRLLDVWDAGLEGVRPARQRRSQDTVGRLITAGRRLLDDRRLESLSVEDVCAASDCTVGAFYSRFVNKDAFFKAVQYVVCQERDRAVRSIEQRSGNENWSLERLCCGLVTDLVDWYQSNHGVLRASLQQVDQAGSGWSPLREVGTRHKAIWVALLRSRLSPFVADVAIDQRVLFVNQIVNGTLVHIVLNDPGPVRLFDPNIAEMLSSVMVSSLRGGE